ncbi:hypothetical protein HF086_002104 [Spodoptera exigua]|uniref:DUF5641 domain-containing protein n=1 Tax=Spodoptera exigua TaxID=7107 RepID=A0A922MLE6_SPOEX|nr:hypothetical protein HF086_002104 [Spodoptera exigua]
MLNLSKHLHSKTLGLLWSCKDDMLLFSSKSIDLSSSANKRTVLATIAQIFDPLGLINPCMLEAKLILQTLSAKNIPWDAELPSDIQSQWNSFILNLQHLNNIQIPRLVLCDSFQKIELHVFCDASLKAYAACGYIRSVSITGNVTVRLLIAKSRVSPLKQHLTMPRLELCAAMLGTQLAKKVSDSLRLNINSKHYWSDSTIVLGWLKSPRKNLKQFVYNRINEILQYSDLSQWKHVPSELNPADIGSRGLNTEQLKNSNLWWGGPHFLHQTDIQWPIQPQNVTENLPETKVLCHLSDQTHIDFTEKFSSFALKNHFWKRYYKEYVSELQRRSKWTKDGSQPHMGDMVLVIDDRIPPAKWLLGRIVAVYPGSDGINRVVDVKTTTGTIRRAFNRLCPLPTLEPHVPRGAAC